MKRILVIGSSGAGKSTFAKRLGSALDIPVIHLDAEYWQAGWRETPKPEWAEKLSKMLAAESWIMDGNFSGTLDLRLQSCDAAIMLELPARVCLWRVSKRFLRYRNQVRPDMAAGCNEKLDWEFIVWIWRYQKQTASRVKAMLNKYANSKQVIYLRSQKEVEAFILRQKQVKR